MVGGWNCAWAGTSAIEKARFGRNDCRSWTAEGLRLPENTHAELRRNSMRLRIVGTKLRKSSKNVCTDSNKLLLRRKAHMRWFA